MIRAIRDGKEIKVGRVGKEIKVDKDGKEIRGLLVIRAIRHFYPIPGTPSTELY